MAVKDQPVILSMIYPMTAALRYRGETHFITREIDPHVVCAVEFPCSPREVDVNRFQYHIRHRRDRIPEHESVGRG